MPGSNLPPEILDHVVGLLDCEDSLIRCCLVSKSWVQRTRMHLSARIRLVEEGVLESWKKTFPDPTDSPGYYTRTLTIGALENTEQGSCIRAFPRIERLVVDCGWEDPTPIGYTISLIPFDLFASSLRSLEVADDCIPLSQIINIVLFLPLLEDLVLIGHDINDEPDCPPTFIPSSTPPALTGTLELFMPELIARVLVQILGLPSSPRFRELIFSWCYAPDLPRVAELVTKCSNTLEILDLTCDIDSDEDIYIDLSRATKLKSVIFRCRTLCCGWIIMMLNTVTSEHRDLQNIIISVPDAFDESSEPMAEEVEAARPGMRWWDLDRLLARFWESRSIPTKFIHYLENERGAPDEWYLLPQAMRREAIERQDR